MLKLKSNTAHKLLTGFTLVELLVSIAVIAILSAIVVTTMTGSRQKSRDAKRVSDINQIRIALEAYFEVHNYYPSNATLLTALETEKFLPSLPADPSGTAYMYVGIKDAQNRCTTYHLGASMESAGSSALKGDSDKSAVSNGSTCTGTDTDFDGSDIDGNGCNGEANLYCYDEFR